MLEVLVRYAHEGLVHIKYQREHVALFHQFPLLNLTLLLEFHMPEARTKLPTAASVLACLVCMIWCDGI